MNAYGSQIASCKNNQANLEKKSVNVHRKGASFHQRQNLGITAPKYDQNLKGETVSLVSAFTDSAGKE